ncbi:MAG: gliding motility-associated C-terminal domain-containing protein [Chryseolinea sp.]
MASIITFGDNTQCSGTPSGFITIQIDGGINPVTDYIIDWFEGNGTATPLGTTVGSTSGVNKETAQSLSSGAYTVRIRDNSTPNSGCFSTATFNVNDNFTYPLVSGASTPNTACDPAKSNGSITADVGGTTVGYSFRIFKGQNTLPVNNVTASATGGLAAGVYTVHAISNATGCAATTEVSVQNNITLPTIDNTASTLVNSCTTPDGTASVTAVSVGVLADYTFSWYNGKSVKAAADYTGSTITGLLAGDYTVTATNNVLGCDVQFPVSLAVANAPSTVITINELIGEQVQPAVCNDGQGQLGVQASSPGNAAGFSFTWFQGDKNIGMTAEGNGQNFPVNSNRISNAASSELISSGLHTVIAVDNTTGCFDSLSLNLPYSDEAALLSVLTFPQTDCLAPDGAFRASIQPSAGTAGNPANVGLDQGWYRIDVYQGGTLIKTVPGVNGTPIAVPIVVTGLGAGNYTVLAVETRTPPLPGCSSEPNDVTIGDSRVYPVILANTLNDNKNCTGSTSDTGSITLTVDGTPTPGAGYSYDWHDGKFLSDPSLAAAKVLAPGHSAINIGGGFYTVQVTKASNNCKAEETLYINNTPFIISIPSTDLSITDQTNCSPANGSATVLNVSTDGVSSVGTAGYSFAWFGNDGTTIVPSSTSNAAIGTLISAGNYFVQTTSGASNCSSSLVPFTVDNISVKPVIAISASMDNSNCSGAAANGSITIDVNGAAPAATDFSIQWFTGVGTSSPLPGATTATLSGLAAGSYTVEVIDILAPGNTCSSTATFVLTDDLPIYSISAASITITDQSDCVANGSASVTDVFIDGISNGGVAGFTFQWFDDAGLAIPGAGSASTIAIPLAAGNYRVLAANITSQCSSIVSLFTVDDIAVKPVITASTLTNNTNCTGVLANGSITIDVNGAVPAASDYTMQWFTGLGTGSPIVGATTATISALASDDYTVEVIDILSPGNSCSTISTFFIDNDLPSYLVSAGFISVSDQSDCVPNGTASITDILIDGVSNAGVAGFTFEWLDNAGVVIAGAGNGAIVGVPLAAGDYFVQATNTTSSCSSSLAPFTVDDISVKPLITISANVDNTNCSGVSGNGSMSINVNGAAPLATDFNIQWFSGIGTGSPITGATTATLSGLMSGDYTVEVTDILSPGNTCVNTATFFINDNVPVYSIDVAAISVSDQTDCVANGSATVTDVLTNGISNGGVGGFTFEWLDNAGLTIAGAGNSATTAIPLSAGNYRVRATNTLSNCTSSFMQFIVNDISVKPVITINALMDNTNCVGAPANGSMSININGVSPAAADFSIQWYTGTGTAAPIVGATTASLSALAAGDYTVRVTDLLSPGNTCVNTATFAISNDLPVYTINGPSISITNQTDCVGNGSASVTDVLIDGVSNAGVAGFSFEWLDNSGIIIPGAGNAATIGVVLAAGDYRVQAKATGSQCSSIISSFTIDDISVKPVVAVNTLVDNTNCSGAARNGSLTITVDGAAPAATDFSIQWYTGTGVSTPIVGATTASLSALGAGSYTVEVTDILSPGNTCSTISTFSISDDLPIYTIATASIAVTDQTDCVSNGSAMVTDVFVDGVSNAGVAGFVFEWLDGAATTISGAGSGATIGVPLAAGSYFVRATSNASNCVSSVTAFSVDDNSIKPAITINSLTDNTNCSGASANGSITIDVNGISPAATAFTIQWYSGTDKSSPVSGATTATLSGLATGSYTVEVIDILSPGNTCSNVATFFIGDDLPVYTISAAAVAITHQTDCSPNGSANVSDVVIDGVSNAGVAGFTFEWFDNAGVTISGAGSGATIGTLLASGSYFVQARSTASSCSSSLIPFTVNNVSVLPGITVNALSDNTNCSGASLNGAISINVNGVAPAATDFTIQWYTGIGTGSPIAGATASSLTGLAAGDYTVQVTDALSPSNTCSSVSTMVVNNAPYIIGLNNTLIAITDNSNCVPTNGSARVTGVMFNGVQGNNTADYTFEWLNKDLTPIDPGTGPTVGATLIAGDYLVRVNHTASTCTSALTPFTIKEMAQVPVVVAVKNMDNVACNTSYTGEASASVSEGLSNGITAGYLFEWFTGANNTNAADLIVTNPVMTGQMEGTYTVRVTDTTAPSANCASITTISINRDVPVINGTLTASPQTTCAPIQDGSIVVNTVQTFALGSTTTYNMNVANDRNKFSFQWFNETRAPVSALAPGVNLSPNFTEGIYYSRITDALGCTSDYINAVVEDLTVKPLVAVQEFTNPAVCVLPEAKGSILVTADNNPNFSDYTFEWHEGATDAGPVAEPNNPLLTNVSYTGITTYTVKVTNNATQCVTLETYKFLTDTVAIQVVASAVPLTSCVTDDGSLFAATRTGSGQLYNIEWYIGAGVGTTPDFTGNEVMVAPIATYTVIARHPNLSFCESIPDTVAVTDGRYYPPVMVTQKDALTYCDPSNPNGVAYASVNGKIAGYSFDWYEGSLNGRLIYTGSEAGILKAITYEVKGTDVISGCYGTANITIESNPLVTPIPEVTLLSDYANCIAPDGALSAAVNGVTKDHIFNWYDGTAVKNQPDAVGEMYVDLINGTYAVTATDRVSGCISAVVQQNVTDARVYPEFEVKTFNTNCDDAIGKAEFVALNDVLVATFEWDIAGAIQNGPFATDLPSGNYTVTAVSYNLCETTMSFELKSDITVYNGVSRNNDGSNDIFEIGCIGDYPNNSVRVFNRAGTLVFETKGYNNEDIFFDGISNRGINILGNTLPDGTYFYIISKGDGSEDRTGYLELLH